MKGSTPKGKNLLPPGSKFFSLRVDFVSEGSLPDLTELSPLKVYHFRLRCPNKYVFYVPFNIILIISWRWKCDNKRLYAMKRR